MEIFGNICILNALNSIYIIVAENRNQLVVNKYLIKLCLICCVFARQNQQTRIEKKTHEHTLNHPL